jgi:hypothetical protein
LLSDVLKINSQFLEYDIMDGLSRDFSASGQTIPVGQFLIKIHIKDREQASKQYIDW